MLSMPKVREGTVGLRMVIHESDKGSADSDKVDIAVAGTLQVTVLAVRVVGLENSKEFEEAMGLMGFFDVDRLHLVKSQEA